MRNSSAALAVAATLVIASGLGTGGTSEHRAFSREEITQTLQAFYGVPAQRLAAAVEKAFEEHGRPNAYIAGEEVSAAPGLGVRYGKGVLRTGAGVEQEIHWLGPSIGVDAKVFVLVFRLPEINSIFQRYSDVEGGRFDGAGVTMDYLQSADTVIAPIRLDAVGLRDTNTGFMDFTREPAVVPF